MIDLDYKSLDRTIAGLTEGLVFITKGLAELMIPYCESPIEIILGVSLLGVDRLAFLDDTTLRFVTPEKAKCVSEKARVLIPQYEWEGRRIDWLLRDPPFNVFIECDGHDFHERTKEQAARDRRKDREVQSSGCPILRFTGSEIFSDPLGCGFEICKFVEKKKIQAGLRKEQPQ